MFKRGNDSKNKFSYKPRTSEQLNKRATQSGGLRDSYVKNEFSMFSAKEGAAVKMRILPPTWSDEPEHWGMDIYVHYGIGPDNATYLCKSKMKEENCLICDERLKAEKEGESDYAKTLAPNKRVLIWLIDRNKDDVGPLLWAMPWTVDRDICKISIDDSGTIIQLDDPENGYDVLFTREGSMQKTKYTGIQVARRSTPLGKDEWLEFVVKNPLPSVLNFFDEEHIRAVFTGKHVEEKVEEAPHSTRSSNKELVENKEQPEEKTEIKIPRTKEELEALPDDVIMNLALEHGITEKDLDTLQFEDLIEKLFALLHPPTQTSTPEPEQPTSYKDRLKALRERHK